MKYEYLIESIESRLKDIQVPTEFDVFSLNKAICSIENDEHVFVILLTLDTLLTRLGRY